MTLISFDHKWNSFSTSIFFKGWAHLNKVYRRYTKKDLNLGIKIASEKYKSKRGYKKGTSLEQDYTSKVS